MRAVIQRVSGARVTVGRETVGSIGRGILLLLGIGKGDSEKDIKYIADKILNLRIFRDDNGKMNISLLDIKGQLLVVSQFTLYGDLRKGNRPGFDKAEKPAEALVLYEKFIEYCKEYGVDVQTGRFGAMMDVKINNDGPVTFIVES